MTREQLLSFIRSNPLATVSTVSIRGAAQAALVGVATSDGFELVFETLDTSRKFLNIRANARVAIVFGAAGPYETGKHDERCVQYEGVAEIPSGDERKRLQETVYFGQFPDGRSRADWPHMAYVRLRPTWIRYSDYNISPPLIVELEGAKLADFIVGR